MSLTEAPAKAKPEPTSQLNFLSHGTLESKDLDFLHRFYEAFLGFEVVQTSKISLLIRLGGDNTIAVVKSKKAGKMSLLNHNGIVVGNQEAGDAAALAAWPLIERELPARRLRRHRPRRVPGRRSCRRFWDRGA